MRLDPDQLEWIVREVVRRLRIQNETLRSPLLGGEGPGERGEAPRDAHITLTQNLITTATLEHKLGGVTRISVPRKAVVTPAARDLLKERNIELTRS